MDNRHIRSSFQPQLKQRVLPETSTAATSDDPFGVGVSAFSGLISAAALVGQSEAKYGPNIVITNPAGVSGRRDPYSNQFKRNADVLLNAATFLDSQAADELPKSVTGRNLIAEFSPSGCMPVLQSQISPLRPSKDERPLAVDVGALKKSGSMPCLTPEQDADPLRLPSFISEFKPEPSLLQATLKKTFEFGKECEVKSELDFSDWTPMKQKPFNMRVVNLGNFPVTQTLYRTNYRSHSTACVRAKMGSIQNTAKSLDLMRSLIQQSINKEIDAIIQRYIEEYFHPAIENIQTNNGDNAVSDEHMQTVCRQILEEAKKIYSSDTRSATPSDNADNFETSSQIDARFGRAGQLQLPGVRKRERERRLSSGSEASSTHTTRPRKKPRQFALLQGGSGRSTPSRPAKTDAIKREGPLWDPDRLKPDTLFVMGSKANKALGLGATRGRLYIKHPQIFKYSGDQDDKQWLHEQHHMPATGGRTYLLIVDDIKELAQTDEYRNSGALQLHELVGFSVPEWMLEKMKFQMQALRTDSRISKLVYDASAFIGSQNASPANTNTSERDDVDNETEMDAEADDRLHAVVAESPMTISRGYVHEFDPTADIEGTCEELIDEDTGLTESFCDDD